MRDQAIGPVILGLVAPLWPRVILEVLLLQMVDGCVIEREVVAP